MLFRILVLTILIAQYGESLAQGTPAGQSAQPAGAELFAAYCAACHTLSADAIAPPLGGVTSLYSRQELAARIRDMQAVIDSGDERAIALRNRYRAVMPPFPALEDAQIQSIADYIEEQSLAQGLAPLEVDLSLPAEQQARIVPAAEPSPLRIELEIFATIPVQPNQTSYKGITLMRPDPRSDTAFFVNDMMGILYRLDGGEAKVFLDIRDVYPQFVTHPGVGTGLGSFALHPNFAENGLFYVTHAEMRRGSPIINEGDFSMNLHLAESPHLEWTLTEWKLKDPTALEFEGDRREILRIATPTTGHGVQQIGFAPVEPGDPDYGMLYISCGDGGAINLKRPDLVGHPHTLLSTIMRIDPLGSNGVNGAFGIPPDNPFANTADPKVHEEIWAYGFRNPHRFSWDMAFGKRMIACDIGESNIEEINLIEPGSSYGWGVPGIEGVAWIDPIADPKAVHFATPEQVKGIHLPIAQYDHSDGQAVTGGFVYYGPLEALRGKYVFGDIVHGGLFFINWTDALADRTVYKIEYVEKGSTSTLREIAGLDRAHMRLAYDGRSGDLFVMTKDDGTIRRTSNAYYEN